MSIPHMLYNVIRSAYIPDMYIASTGQIRAKHLVGLDGAPVLERDGLTAHQYGTLRPRRNAQCFGFFDKKGTAWFLLKDEAEAARPAMGHWKGADGKILVLEEHAGLQIDQMD